MRGDGHVRFGQHHFHIGKDRLEIGPLARHGAQQALVREIGQRLARAIPSG